MVALRLLQMMSDYNVETIVIFMVSYIDGDKDVRYVMYYCFYTTGLLPGTRDATPPPFQREAPYFVNIFVHFDAQIWQPSYF